MIFIVSVTVGGGPGVLLNSTLTPTPILTSTLEPTATPTPTRTRTPTLTTMPLRPGPTVGKGTPTALAPGLGDAQCYDLVLTSKDVNAQRNAIIQQLKSLVPNDSRYRAGLVLVWVHGYDTAEGADVAARVSELIRQEFPESFGRDTKFKSLYFGYGLMYYTQVEVYFMNISRWQNGMERPCRYTE